MEVDFQLTFSFLVEAEGTIRILSKAQFIFSKSRLRSC